MAQRVEKIAHAVAREIVSEVVAGDLAAGTVLDSESEMMERYEVSRGSLREALRILEVLGFVQMKPGPRGGPVLLDPDSRQFSTIATLFYQRIRATYRELLETRLVLEPEAAAMAAERRTEEQVELLKNFIEASRVARLSDDRQFRAVGQGFHDLVAEMCANPIIKLLIGSCYDVFAGRTSGFLYPLEHRQTIQSIHEQIAVAVMNGNSRTARSLMYDHMEDYVRQASQQFSGLMSEVVKW
jgi:GntR family transcriptional regulator, transcriptional repressor for pyruvate dehydrogenase complex